MDGFCCCSLSVFLLLDQLTASFLIIRAYYYISLWIQDCTFYNPESRVQSLEPGGYVSLFVLLVVGCWCPRRGAKSINLSSFARIRIMTRFKLSKMSLWLHTPSTILNKYMRKSCFSHSSSQYFLLFCIVQNQPNFNLLGKQLLKRRKGVCIKFRNTI